jgi:transcriptional regulator with XRE-family HTH domain
MSQFSGAHIRAIRIRQHLRREQVAVAAGVSATALARYELNDAVPNVNAAARLADALGVTIGDLFDDAPKPPAPAVTDLPAWAQSLIRELRTEAATYRRQFRVTASAEAA